jgi:hypothetical protein
VNKSIVNNQDGPGVYQYTHEIVDVIHEQIPCEYFLVYMPYIPGMYNNKDEDINIILSEFVNFIIPITT